MPSKQLVILSEEQKVENNNPIVQAPVGGNDNKMGMWLIVGLVVVILVVGAVYWYLSSQQTPSQPVQQPGSQAETIDNLDQELNSIEVGTADSDFTSVDSDLQSL